jgi:hypothetical protein
MKTWILAATLILQGICFAQERFILESELQTTYLSSGAVSTFAVLYYDSAGNRIQRRVFDGVDSLAALRGRIVSSYDSQKRCTQELALSADNDTISIVRYVHGSDGPVSIATLPKDSTVRFTDSLLYAGGHLSEQRHYTAEGAMSSYRRYSYAAGLLAADSLYEPDGGSGFSATDARLISRNSDGTVSQEAQWHVSEGQWYQVSTTEMTWHGGNQIAASTYKTDGAAKQLMDSIAWTYDSFGNRIKEERFNYKRVKIIDIISTWRDMQPTGVTAGALLRSQQCMSICQRNGRLEFGVPVSGSVLLLRADGRQVRYRGFENQRSIALNTGLSTGRYVALVRGSGNQKASVSIY